MKRLEVILKISERCNIDCTYCYFFNGPDDSYKLHSKSISAKTVEKVAAFLARGLKELGVLYLQIILHGGEPLLMSKIAFVHMCEIFQRSLSPLTRLEFCLQTNAILIDEDWIDIFSRFDIKVSTSLDGPQIINDKNRIHFNGKGTYQETIKGVSHLRKAQEKGKIEPYGVICVINPQESANIIYHHFVNELGLNSMEFLLPDETHDTYNAENTGLYASFLITLFDNWFLNDDPKIQIRILNSIVSLFLGGKSYVSGFGTNNANAFTISSDGHLSPDDILRSSGNIINTGFDVENVQLADLTSHLDNLIQKNITENLSNECKSCCWFAVCGGTHPVHRYSNKNGFSNKSVFCEDLMTFYAHVATTLLKKGLSLKELISNLKIETSLVV